MMNQTTEKAEFRALLKLKRKAISPSRREEARVALLERLRPILAPFKAVLSFHSLPDEIDTSLLNSHLQNKLLLPKICGQELHVYKAAHLEPSSFGLHEPDPTKCQQIPLEEVDCVLVPGLGFDQNLRRIGYGKGHYDRLLAQLRMFTQPPLIIGIGFKEQRVDALPYEEHDIALDHILTV